MFSVPGSVRVFVATTPVDLRRGFDGLAGLTREVLEQDPLSGHLFAFRNRRGLAPSKDPLAGPREGGADGNRNFGLILSPGCSMYTVDNCHHGCPLSANE